LNLKVLEEVLVDESVVLNYFDKCFCLLMMFQNRSFVEIQIFFDSLENKKNKDKTIFKKFTDLMSTQR